MLEAGAVRRGGVEHGLDLRDRGGGRIGIAAGDDKTVEADRADADRHEDVVAVILGARRGHVEAGVGDVVDIGGRGDRVALQGADVSAQHCEYRGRGGGGPLGGGGLGAGETTAQGQITFKNKGNRAVGAGGRLVDAGLDPDFNGIGRGGTGGGDRRLQAVVSAAPGGAVASGGGIGLNVDDLGRRPAALREGGEPCKTHQGRKENPARH